MEFQILTRNIKGKQVFWRTNLTTYMLLAWLVLTSLKLGFHWCHHNSISSHVFPKQAQAHTLLVPLDSELAFNALEAEQIRKYDDVSLWLDLHVFVTELNQHANLHNHSMIRKEQEDLKRLVIEGIERFSFLCLCWHVTFKFSKYQELLMFNRDHKEQEIQDRLKVGAWSSKVLVQTWRLLMNVECELNNFIHLLLIFSSAFTAPWFTSRILCCWFCSPQNIAKQETTMV